MIPRHMYITQLHYDKPANGQHLGFPHTLPFLQGFDSLSFKKPVTIFVGENGTGKSTLIETLAALMELNLEGGSKNHRFETEASHSSLYQYCRLTRGAYRPRDAYFYRAETFYNLATDMDQFAEGEGVLSQKLFGRNLHTFSRGEAMTTLMNDRFFGNGFYLMDEPETGLSVNSQLQILLAIKERIAKNSQFIFATHSPILILYPGAQVFQLSEGGIKEIAAEETQLFNDWRMIMERNSYFIHQLFSD